MAFTVSAALSRAAAGKRAVLTLPALEAALAKVRVNGQPAGAILWAPYEVDVTELLIDGANEIEIELVSTLRNLLGPHHRSTGEPTHTWKTAFDHIPDRGRNPHPEELEASWTDDYFFLHFGIRGEASVRYMAAAGG